MFTPIGVVVLGGLVYHGYAVADRATYRLDVFDRDSPARQSVLIQAYTLEDADDTEHLVTQAGVTTGCPVTAPRRLSTRRSPSPTA